MSGNLTYAAIAKKEKLKEMKQKKDDLKHSLTVLGIIIFTLALYIYLGFSRIASYIMPFVDKSFTESAATKTLDLAVIFILILMGIIFYYKSIKLSKVKKDYDKLRWEVVRMIRASACDCKTECDCGEKLIKEMERYGIDIIFETKFTSE